MQPLIAGGIRIGTAELYTAVVENMRNIQECLAAELIYQKVIQESYLIRKDYFKNNQT